MLYDWRGRPDADGPEANTSIATSTVNIKSNNLPSSFCTCFCRCWYASIQIVLHVLKFVPGFNLASWFLYYAQICKHSPVSCYLSIGLYFYKFHGLQSLLPSSNQFWLQKLNYQFEWYDGLLLRPIGALSFLILVSLNGPNIILQMCKYSL